MKTDIPETVIHTSYIPWLARIDALIGKPARLDLARHTSFIGGVARGPQPARGGRRCQEPLECPTLATLADALVGVNGCRPGWAARFLLGATATRRPMASRRMFGRVIVGPSDLCVLHPIV